MLVLVQSEMPPGAGRVGGGGGSLESPDDGHVGSEASEPNL